VLDDVGREIPATVREVTKHFQRWITHGMLDNGLLQLFDYLLVF
jgi:hypothetical protein